MKKVKIGVMGVYRGNSMIKYCKLAENAELVAICDKWEEGLEEAKKENEGLNIAYYNNFEDFIKHDMDAVVLANYANEHAPFAIAAMKAGKHVFSEVLPCQTMKEAVELVETVEATGKIYAYGENYCYMQDRALFIKISLITDFFSLYRFHVDTFAGFVLFFPRLLTLFLHRQANKNTYQQSFHLTFLRRFLLL